MEVWQASVEDEIIPLLPNHQAPIMKISVKKGVENCCFAESIML
jgi:hypothetical protein